MSGQDSLSPPRIRIAKLDENADQLAVLELLDHYARHPMGQSAALESTVRDRLIAGLRQHPTSVIFLAELGPKPVGLAICFVGFSTFKARPLMNVHDLVVHESVRRRGIGGGLLDEVIRYAKVQGCCGVTLEVRGDNPARELYAQKGFEGLLPTDQASEITYFGKLTWTP